MTDDIIERLYAEANRLSDPRSAAPQNLRDLAELLEEAAQEIEALRSRVRHPDTEF